MKAVRKRMEENAQSYNQHLTKSYVRSLKTRPLLGLCHPNNRSDFIRDLEKSGSIGKEESKRFRFSFNLSKTI